MKRFPVLACAALAVFLLGGAPSSVPGEWLVTFAESSATRRSLEQAGPDDYAERLAKVVAELSEAVGVPLRAGSAAGGGTWVVSVDARRTLASIEERVAAAGVSGIRSVAAERNGLWEIPHDRELRVEVARGAERARLEKSLAAAPFPVSVAESGGELAVRVDWRALTEVVAERLRAQPDVATVELNEIATPSTGSSRGSSCA